MLTSPLQWPLLALAIGGLAVMTYVTARAALARNVLTRAFHIGMRVAMVSFVGLVVIDFAAIYVVGRTQMVGLRFAIGMFIYFVTILLPLTYSVRRLRQRKGWLPPSSSSSTDSFPSFEEQVK